MKTCIRLPSANERILLPKGGGGNEKEHRHGDEKELVHFFNFLFCFFGEPSLPREGRPRNNKQCLRYVVRVSHCAALAAARCSPRVTSSASSSSSLMPARVCEAGGKFGTCGPYSTAWRCML